MNGPFLIWGPAKVLPKSFLMATGCFVCLLLIYIYLSNVSLCHTFYLIQKVDTVYFPIPIGDIISRYSLSTIHSQMSYSTTVKTFGILMCLHTFRNCFFNPRFSIIVKCPYVHCMQVLFIHWC